jgi:hypothetical protein
MKPRLTKAQEQTCQAGKEELLEGQSERVGGAIKYFCSVLCLVQNV